MTTKERFAEIMHEVCDSDEGYREALEVVRINCSGKIWLFGGFIYRNLVKAVYGKDSVSKDFDFIVEKLNENLVVPDGWNLRRTRFGSPGMRGKSEIDIVPIYNVHAIRKKNLDCKIENYLWGVPLNIHNFVYEVDSRELFGEAGINSILEKVVRVHNLEMALDAARIYSTSVNEMIRKKAEELEFNYELM